MVVAKALWNGVQRILASQSDALSAGALKLSKNIVKDAMEIVNCIGAIVNRFPENFGPNAQSDVQFAKAVLHNEEEKYLKAAETLRGITKASGLLLGELKIKVQH